MIHFYARDLGEGAFLTYCLKFTHPPSPQPQNLLHVFTDFAVSVYCCLPVSVGCYSENHGHQNIGCLSFQLMSNMTQFLGSRAQQDSVMALNKWSGGSELEVGAGGG